MAKYRVDVEWNESTEYHLEIEAASAEEADGKFREMWNDGSWRDRAIEDEYYNDDSSYIVAAQIAD